MKKKLPKPSIAAISTTQARQSPQFPSILRFITEYSLSDKTVHAIELFSVSFVSGLLLLGIAFQVITLRQHLAEEQRLSAAREQVAYEINYWKQVADVHKDYRDVYYRLATLSYKVGKLDDAKKYLQKALELDPNFKEGKVLGAKIGF